jgi:hypothetical protein
MAIKTFTTGEVLTASDTNTYLANSGLVYVKEQTVGAGVSSVTVSDAFSSTYDNYKIIYAGGTANTAQAITLKLGASVTTYAYSTVIYAYAGGAATVLTNASSGAFDYAGEANTNNNNVCLDVLNPNVAKYTTIQGSYVGGGSGGFAYGVHKTATAYTSFILAVAGNITGGIIYVYGYRKA